MLAQLTQQKTVLLHRMNDLEEAWEEVNSRNRKEEITILDDKLWEFKEQISEYEDALNQDAPAELDEQLTDVKEKIDQTEATIEDLTSKLETTKQALIECEKGLVELLESTSKLEDVDNQTSDQSQNYTKEKEQPKPLPDLKIELHQVREIVTAQDLELTSLAERETEMEMKLTTLRSELARRCSNDSEGDDNAIATETKANLQKCLRVLELMQQVAKATTEQRDNEGLALDLTTELNRLLLQQKLANPNANSNSNTPTSAFRSRAGTLMNATAKPPPKPPKPDKNLNSNSSSSSTRKRFGTMAV